MRAFTATTEGPNRLGLRELLQRYADEQWVADHITDEQVAASMFVCFQRALRYELELLDLHCSRGEQSTRLTWHYGQAQIEAVAAIDAAG